MLYNYYRGADSGDILISLREVAQEQRTNYEVLLARLDAGWPLGLALSMPADWKIYSVTEDDCGELYFEISKIVTPGYREEILDSIKF